MKTMTKMMLAATAAISGLSAATAANAAIVINLTQVGTSVFASGAGSFNTTALPSGVGGNFRVGLTASLAVIRFGTGSSGRSFRTYNISGPTSIGPGASDYREGVGVGDIFGIYGFASQLILPTGYVSGAALAGTITFANSTFSSLGLTTGTYSFSNSDDTVTVNIGPVAAVPEPATWGLMIAGFGMMGAGLRTRRRSTKVSFA